MTHHTHTHSVEDVKAWKGKTLMGADGDKIGKVEDVYLDEQTGRPEWLAVATGLFGSRVTFVPLAEAATSGDDLRVPYSKEQVKDAPNAEADGQLSQAEESKLYRHFGLDYGEARSGSGLPEGREERFDRGAGRDTSGPNTDSAMTRSEEELRVGTTEREAGRARLRKVVVTEEVQTTIPVTREEVRIEREPITDANVDRATDGPAISEEEHEVVLHEEEPVVEKRVVPKERVRLEKDVVTEERAVSDEVRKEQIRAEGDGRTR